MKLNVIINSVRSSALLLGATMLLAGCQHEEFVGPDALPGKEGVVNFAPSVGGIVSGVKSGYSEGASAAVRTQSLSLTSEDGKYTIPMDLTVTSMDAGIVTKAALINENGGITDAVFAEAVDNAFNNYSC